MAGHGARVVMLLWSVVAAVHLVGYSQGAISPQLPCSSGVRGVFVVGAPFNQQNTLQYYNCETQQTAENLLTRDRIYAAEIDWNGQASEGVPKIYYIEVGFATGDSMYRSNLDGTGEELLRTMTTGTYSHALALDPPNNRLWFVSQIDQIIAGSMDGSGNDQVIQLPFPSAGITSDVVYDPQGDIVYIALDRGGVARMDAAGGPVEWFIQDSYVNASALAFNPQSVPGSLYIVSKQGSGYVQLGDASMETSHVAPSWNLFPSCAVDTVAQTVYISSYTIGPSVANTRIDIADLSGNASETWLYMDGFTISSIILDLIGLYPPGSTSNDATTSLEASVTSMTSEDTSVGTGNVTPVTSDGTSEDSGTVVGLAIVFSILGVLCIVAVIVGMFLYLRGKEKPDAEKPVSIDMEPPKSTVYSDTTVSFSSQRTHGAEAKATVTKGQEGKEKEGDPDEYGKYVSTEGYGAYAPVSMEKPSQEKKNQQKTWDIRYEDITLEGVIGKGAYGIVHKGKWRNVAVAVKLIITEMSKDEFLAEAELMHNLRPHDNVMQLLGVCSQPVAIISKFYENGSLLDWILSGKEMSTPMIVKILLGIAAGMHHLHEENVIHRDLASRNILLNGNLEAVVSDFGFARTMQDSVHKTASTIGPIKWMAPESLLRQSFSKKSDVWSFGVTVWEMLTRSEPYADLDQVNTILQVTQGKRLEVPDDCPPRLKELVEQCLSTKPEDRPDFQQIYDRLQ